MQGQSHPHHHRKLMLDQLNPDDLSPGEWCLGCANCECRVQTAGDMMREILREK